MFSWYATAYPYVYYNDTEFVFLWYDMAYSNDYYNGAKVFYTMIWHTLMSITV